MLRHLIFLLSLMWGLVAQAAIVSGNSQGSVTMDVVYDYQCPHCHAMYPLIQSLQQHNPDLKIRWMPVALLNEVSLEQATTAIAATRDENTFWLYSNAALIGMPLTQQQNNQLLESLGLNTTDFLISRHAAWVKQVLDEGQARLQQFHIAAVPLIVVYPTNQTKTVTIFEGEQSYQQLQEAMTHAEQGH